MRSAVITPDAVSRTARAKECELCQKLFRDVMFQSALGLATTVQEFQEIARWFDRELTERIRKLQGPPTSPLRASTPTPLEQNA